MTGIRRKRPGKLQRPDHVVGMRNNSQPKARYSSQFQPVGGTMSRSILDEAHIHAAIRDTVARANADIVAEVKAAIAANAVVVVGMAQNPHPRRARALLDAAKIPYRYLEYGNYFSGWRRRSALKMWTGWQTFPMVFIKGVLVGGASDLKKLIASGELDTLLKGDLRTAP
jgi:monothiol glutaredoxin